MPTDGGVYVQGLDEFRRELNTLDKSMGKELGKVNKKAAEFVADKARSSARAQGSSLAKGADTITASARQSAASVTIGGTKAPWMLGAEFGSIKYGQFKPWRGNQWNPDSGGVGYALHPTIRETREQFMDLYGDLIADLTQRAFPD